MANMTPQQAAEVLRRHLQWRKQKEHESDIAYVGPDALTAALETAIECLEATRFAVPMTRDQQTGEFVLSADKAAQALGISHHTPPTDEQIGEVFDRNYDSVSLIDFNDPSMTRTAAIRFAKALFGQFKSER